MTWAPELLTRRDGACAESAADASVDIFAEAMGMQSRVPAHGPGPLAPQTRFLSYKVTISCGVRAGIWGAWPKGMPRSSGFTLAGCLGLGQLWN